MEGISVAKNQYIQHDVDVFEDQYLPNPSTLILAMGNREIQEPRQQIESAAGFYMRAWELHFNFNIQDKVIMTLSA